MISLDAFDVEAAFDKPAPSHAGIPLKPKRLARGPEQNRRSLVRSREKLPGSVVLPAGE
jgi:hypothetical protein